MSKGNLERVREAYEAFNRRDWDAAAAFLDESITWAPVFSVETTELRGKDAVRGSWVSAVESLDVHIEILELIPVGNAKVVAVAEWTGRGSASGTPIGATIAQVMTLRDGLGIKVESYRGKREALEAAGLRE
jgi:ketosteroid isomerase-like protein